jgi:uncharacterized membrane protein
MIRVPLRRLHLVIGIAGVIAFLLTGQYMDLWLAHLEGMPDLPRMLYRSGHIYLLFAALLNLVLGLYLDEERNGWRQHATQLGSGLILIGPMLLLIGWGPEAVRTDLERPYSRPAIYASFAGVLLHGMAAGTKTGK